MSLSVNIPPKGIGYQPIDFENAVARWLAEIFKDFTIVDPLDNSKELPIGIHVSDVPERNDADVNTNAPYVVVQFVKQRFIENGCVLKMRLLICTYGADRINTRRDNEIIGAHVTSNLTENYLSVLSPFTVYLKNTYPIEFEVFDNSPVPNYCFGIVTFYATSYNVTNTMLEALNSAQI